MIGIELRGKRLCAVLDPDHPQYKNVYIMVRSLLNSREITRNVWAIDYNSLVILKDKLNKFGLTEDRTITGDAKNLVDWITAQHVKNENIKNGEHNEYIKSLLEGKTKTIPYEDQYTAIAYLVGNQKCGLFDDLGAGKTGVSLWSILAVPEIRKTLVVCPKTVIPGFIREIKKHTDLKYLEIPAGRKEASYFLKKHKDDDYNIILVHPENLIGGKKNEIYGAITKILSKMVWDCVIVDEFHMYKNLSAKRTKCVLSLLTETRNREGKDPRCVLMTGTPVSENPLNAYTALKVLSFVPHISRFKHYYCIEKEVNHGSGTHFEIVGYKNLDELKVWLDQVSIRRTKAEMKGFPERPPPIERDVFLTGKHLEQYNLIRDEVIKELKEMSPKEVFDLQKWLGSAKAIRLRQILNHPGVLDATGDSCKYKELDNILEEILADKENKVVVWTEYRKAVDLLYERYNTQYGVQKLYGGVDITENLIKDFEETDKKRIIAAIPAKAGTGTDFLARARYFIYVDLPYSYTLYKQSLDRGHRRIPQSGNLSKLDKIRSSPLTVIFLHAENTVDSLVRDKLHRKEDLVDALTVKEDVLIKIGREEVLRYLK